MWTIVTAIWVSIAGAGQPFANAHSNAILTVERTPAPMQVPAEPRDSLIDGMGKGALAGAGGMLALWTAAERSCGIGCERSGPAGASVLVGGFGAAIGSVVGLFADLDAGPLDRPGVRAGPVYSHTAFRSTLVDGGAAAPGISAAVRLSPHISVHAEYTATNGRFLPAPGTIPPDVLANVVPAASRRAGRVELIENRRVSYVFSQLVGVHPRPWGPVRIALLAGLGVQGQENRNYYEADIAGKYHVLDFKTPEIGFVMGLDAEVAVARHIVIVPMLRYNAMGDPGPSMTYGAGVHWRF